MTNTIDLSSSLGAMGFAVNGGSGIILILAKMLITVDIQ